MVYLHGTGSRGRSAGSGRGQPGGVRQTDGVDGSAPFLQLDLGVISTGLCCDELLQVADGVFGAALDADCGRGVGARTSRRKGNRSQ